MTPLNLLILVLATWRLAYMLTKERGPYAIFETLRKWGFLVHVLGCIHCTSVWLAVPLWILTLTPLWFVVYGLAISGAALMLHRYVGFHVE